jgi:predicted nucleic acid-binding protein
MARRISFAGSTIRKSGAYSETSVRQTQGSPLGDNGSLLIVGEAETGAPGDVEGIQVFNSTQFAALVSEFSSGPIVDVAKAALQSPSRLLGVGQADTVYVWKTNSSTKASLVLETAAPEDLIRIKDRNFGAAGNQISVQVAAGTDSARQRIVTVRKGNSVQVLDQNAAEPQLVITYTGSGDPAVLNIAGTLNNKTLTTACTDAAGDNLSISLNNFASMKDLAEFINSQANYTCTLGTPLKATITKPSSLDPVTAVNIASAATLYRLQQEIVDVINDNALLVEAELIDIEVGVPAVLAATLLSGGAKGASTSADFSDGFAKSLASDVNVIIPAISRDASADIADALTDAGSTYDIDAVAAALSTHLNLRSNTRNKREAQGMVGFRDAVKANVFTFCQTINNGLIQVFAEDCLVSDLDANLVWKQPHVLAGIAAGIRLGTEVGEPLTHKYPNCNGTGHVVNPLTGLPTGDLNTDIDYDSAIEAGLTFTERAKGGVRFVLDNTTYGSDQNFYLNRGSVIEAAQFVAKDLRQTSEDFFVGKKVANGAAKSMITILGNRLDELNVANIIIQSDDGAPKGWKDLSVQINGSVARVQVKIYPAVGMEFILISFSLGELVQAA